MITRGGPDRRMKVCKCSNCRLVAVCSPRCDFYTLEGQPTGPLYCERCFAAKHGITRILKEKR